MDQHGAGRHRDAPSSGPGSHAEIDVVEGDGEGAFVKAAKLAPERPRRQHRRRRHRGAAMGQAEATEGVLRIPGRALPVMPGDAAVAEDHPGVLDRPVGEEQPGADDADLRQRHDVFHLLKPVGRKYLYIIV